jgi:hypothetical protein
MWCRFGEFDDRTAPRSHCAELTCNTSEHGCFPSQWNGSQPRVSRCLRSLRSMDRMIESLRTRGETVRNSGKLNGTIMRTTPLGSRRMQGFIGVQVRSKGGLVVLVHL